MNQYGIEPMSTTVLGLLPTMGGTIVAFIAWLYCCRYLCRKADAAHRHAVAAAGSRGAIVAASGTPSDRLWFRSLAVVAVSFMLYLGAHWFGLTPASQAERAFIATVIQAGEDAPAIRSKVKALEAVMQSDYYVSRRHFMLAEQISEQI